MKNKKTIYTLSSVIIIFLLSIIIFSLGDKISMNFSLSNLRAWVSGNAYSEIIFIILWCARVVFFIPGVTLMILGGLIFKPGKAFLLSLLGLIISDGGVFLLGKTSLLNKYKEKVILKHPELMQLIEEYNYKILAVGVLCPISPTDIIVFLSSYTGMDFMKFALIFMLGNVPAVFLYSYLGESFQGSMLNTVFIVSTLIVSALLSIKVWNDFRNKLSQQNR